MRSPLDVAQAEESESIACADRTETIANDAVRLTFAKNRSTVFEDGNVSRIVRNTGWQRCSLEDHREEITSRDGAQSLRESPGPNEPAD